MCLSLGPPGKRACSKHWSADTLLKKYRPRVAKVSPRKKKKERPGNKSRPNRPSVLQEPIKWDVCQGSVFAQHMERLWAGKKKKSWPKCRPKERRKRGIHLPGSLLSPFPSGQYHDRRLQYYYFQAALFGSVISPLGCHIKVQVLI